MKTILAAVDFSELTSLVIDSGIEMALSFGAKLYLVHIVSPDPEFVGYNAGPQVVRNAVAKTFRKEHQELQELSKQARQRGVSSKALLIQGPTVEKLLQEVDKLQGDLIIVGSHGRGAMYDMLVGSTSEALIRRAKCRILIVPRLSHPEIS